MKFHRYIVAYHEAGHAVVAWRLGVKVRNVTIEPGDDYEGRVIFWSRSGNTKTEEKILISLAGPYAQKRYAPRSDWRTLHDASSLYHETDFSFARLAMVRALQLGDKSGPLYFKYAQARVEELVGVYWEYIDIVARALIERDTLTGDAMIAVIYQAKGLAPPGANISA